MAVRDNSGGNSLTATGYKIRGLQKANLRWSGIAATFVDIYRDGILRMTTESNGFYTDDIDLRGKGSYIYKVCDAGSRTCSNEVLVEF